jgi:hypothetical protein
VKRLHAACVGVALFFSSAFCYGVSFYLFDANTKQEIPSGTIRIAGNGLNLSVSYTAGDPDAFNIAAGAYTFTFSAPGYKDSSVAANLGSALSFSIGLKASSALRFNDKPHRQTPFDVHYDKHGSVLHISGNTSRYGICALSIYAVSGRKVFAINRRFDGTEFESIKISVPSLAHGFYYVVIDQRTTAIIKVL